MADQHESRLPSIDALIEYTEHSHPNHLIPEISTFSGKGQTARIADNLVPNRKRKRIEELNSTQTDTSAESLSTSTSYVSVVPPLHPADGTQKENMLSGRKYVIDGQLKQELDRCSIACKNFNNHTRESDARLDSKTKLFKQVLLLHDIPGLPSTHVQQRLNRLGKNVCVDTPFTCSFGYNITLGHDVKIKRGCEILDACRVVIGDGCILEGNVTIMADDWHKSFDHRGFRFRQGRPVSIEAHCIIGKDVKIMPGCRIGMESRILPGAVVFKNIPRYSVFGGNPARRMADHRPDVTVT